jgi:predicted DNA repair protein MutK
VTAAASDPAVDMVAFERTRIRGAIRTDFILSAEIVIITLGTVQSATLAQRVGVLTAVAVAMTFGVYGLVGAIVKLDDVGAYCVRRGGRSRGLGLLLLALAPRLMQFLSVAGTAAMFLVGGGILVHGWTALHHAMQTVTERVQGVLEVVVSSTLEGLLGVAAGAVAVGLVTALKRLRPAT